MRSRSRRRAPRSIILGSGPNRIGQGIEFDYCCCHAAFALREEGFETVMVNCNPETVSTDYDTVDRLYFEPLTFEDVFSIITREREGGGDVSCRRAVRRADAAEAGAAAAGGRASGSSAPRRIRSTSPRIASASPSCCGSSASRRRRAASPTSAEEAREVADDHRVPAGRAPVLRARRPGHGHRLRHGRARPLHDARRRRLARPSGADRQVPRGCRRARRRRGGRFDRRRGHRRHHGAHRGSGHPLRRQLLRHPAVQGDREAHRR